MTDSPDPTRSPPPHTGGWLASVVPWLLVGMVGLTVLSLAAVHAPVQVKKVGLFSLACGLAAGWGLAKLAQGTGFVSRRWAAGLTCVLIATGQIGTALESHRLFRADLQRQPESPVPMMAQLFLQSEPPDDPEARQHYDEMRRVVAGDRAAMAEAASFTGWLRHRVSRTPLGHWSDGTLLVLWGGEVLLAALAGAWVVARSLPRAQDSRKV